MIERSRLVRAIFATEDKMERAAMPWERAELRAVLVGLQDEMRRLTFQTYDA